MPLQYRGVIAEHRAVRERVGTFDISHMGKFTLWGPELGSHLSRLVPSDLSAVPVGSGRYTVLLNPLGAFWMMSSSTGIHRRVSWSTGA
jgi:aminomethyltransferase